MNKPVKAVLLSVLLYPGAGHFFLKKYVSCFALAGIFSIPLIFVMNDIFNKANQVIEQIKNGEIPLDVAAITEAISTLTSGSEAHALNVKIYVMITVWVIGIFDAYRLSKAKA
jgi:hypothetical protein